MNLRLHAMSSRAFAVVFVLFFCGVGLCLLLGFFAPPLNVDAAYSTWGCPQGDLEWGPDCTGVDMKEGDEWTGTVGNLTRYNQYIVMGFQPMNVLRTALRESIELEVKISARNAETEPWITLLDWQTHIRTVNCGQGALYCDKLNLVYEPFLTFQHYRFAVQILTPAIDLPWMGDVLISYSYANAAFTLFELWSRFAFMLGTLGVGAVMFFFIRAHRLAEWTVEQRWAGAMLLGLFFYNDPFFFLSFYVDTWFFVLLDQLMAVTFLAQLLLFWVIMMDALRKTDAEQRTLKAFYLPKVAVVGTFWLTSASVFIWVELYSYNDPSFATPLAHPGFVVVLVAMVLEALGYLGYLMFLLVMALCHSNAIPASSSRVKFFGLFTLGVIVLTVVGILGGFLGSLRTTGIEFLAFFGLFNFYVWILTIMYLPSGSASSTPLRGGLELVTLGSVSDDDLSAPELDFSTSTDLEISLSDVNMRSPTPTNVPMQTHIDE